MSNLAKSTALRMLQAEIKDPSHFCLLKTAIEAQIPKISNMTEQVGARVAQICIEKARVGAMPSSPESANTWIASAIEQASAVVGPARWS